MRNQATSRLEDIQSLESSGECSQPRGRRKWLRDLRLWYAFGMKSNAKSSFTLPAEEVRLVKKLKGRIRAKTNVEVIRRSLRLLDETTEREALREAYRSASAATRDALSREREELDHLSGEALD